MVNPVLVEVLREGRVESRHRGALVVADARGAIIGAIGDIHRPVYPRSAVKAIQALPLVETGAADAFALTDAELALVCASHSGAPEHVALVEDLLARIGLDSRALACGAHWPTRQEEALALARSNGSPTPAHNNCSGKHAGFLCVCRFCRFDTQGYTASGHPVQDLVRQALQDVTGAPHGPANAAIDGCSIPTYKVPLAALATGFARMATGEGLAPVRAAAARRLIGACMAEPFYMSGAQRADLRLMGAAPGRIFVKTGAEGVYCAAVPEFGLAIALKCDDGATRASEVMIAAALGRVFGDNGETGHRLGELARPVLFNWNNLAVGAMRPAGAMKRLVSA